MSLPNASFPDRLIAPEPVKRGEGIGVEYRVIELPKHLKQLPVESIGADGLIVEKRISVNEFLVSVPKNANPS